MNFTKKFSATSACAAMIMLGMAPANAAPLAVNVTPKTPIATSTLGWNADVETANRHRRGYGGFGVYGGYGGYGGYGRYRGGVDGGDILAGILIVGGIAAIASAAANSSRSRYEDRRYEDRRYEDRRYERERYERRDDNRRNEESRYENQSYQNRAPQGTNDVQTAISVCSNAAVQQAGRDARVSDIQSVSRDGNGWRVEGGLSNNQSQSFLCGSSNGRVDFVQIGDGNIAYARR